MTYNILNNSTAILIDGDKFLYSIHILHGEELGLFIIEFDGALWKTSFIEDVFAEDYNIYSVNCLIPLNQNHPIQTVSILRLCFELF